MTLGEIMREAESFGDPYRRVVLFDGEAVKADYRSSDEIDRLTDGTYFDSCLECRNPYAVGHTLICFVDVASFPLRRVDALMSNRKRKWSCYTVTHRDATVMLNDGTVIKGRNLNELAKKL